MIKQLLIAILFPAICFAWGAGDGRQFIGDGSATATCSLTTQDFTDGYTENDSYNQLTVTSDSIAFDSAGNATAYVRKDFGASYFDDDLTIRWKWTRTNTVSWARHVGLALTSSTTELESLEDTGDLVYVELRNGASDEYIRLHVVNGGSAVTGSPDSYSGIVEDTEYFIEFYYDLFDGSYGSFTVEVYTGSYGGTLIDTLTVDATEDLDARYLYTYDAYKNGNAYSMTGEITDYEVGSCLLDD